jgi:translation initiation factor 2B subunit (eIF-2B alpha/beta/delta family)
LQRRAELLDGLGQRLGDAARPFVETCDRVVTISRSSAVAAAVEGAWRQGWRGEVVVFDGSPTGCGADQAARLAETIATVRSQPDATMPRWLDGGGVLALIGADAVSRQRLVNACGTRILLELAAARSLPVVLAADSGKDVADEEIDEILVAGPVATTKAPGRCWPIFETVPMSLVSDRIAE